MIVSERVGKLGCELRLNPEQESSSPYMQHSQFHLLLLQPGHEWEQRKSRG